MKGRAKIRGGIVFFADFNIGALKVVCAIINSESMVKPFLGTGRGVNHSLEISGNPDEKSEISYV